MATSDEMPLILHSCRLARAVCAMKGMALCLFQELLEKGVLTDDVEEVLSGYFESDGAYLDLDGAMEIIEEAEVIFKRVRSHSGWLRKAQQFRQCLKKLETMLARFGEIDTSVEYSEAEE